MREYIESSVLFCVLGRTQVVKCNSSISLPASINTSIVQGSGIGPMLCNNGKRPSYNVSYEYANKICR